MRQVNPGYLICELCGRAAELPDFVTLIENRRGGEKTVPVCVDCLSVMDDEGSDTC